MAKQHLFRRKARPGQPANLTWHAWYVDAAGHRVRFSTGCTDKQAAAKVLAERERADAAQAAAGLAADSAGLTIEDLTYHLAVEAHTSTSGRPISAGTRKMYREKGGHLNRLLRVCGGCAVSGDLAVVMACETSHASTSLVKLKRADVVRYVDHRLAEGAARTTVKKELNTLSVALKHAANRGWVPHAAAVECVPPFAAQSPARTRWLTQDEFPRLLAALDTTAWMAKRVADLPPAEAEAKLRAHRAHVGDRQLFVTVACLTGAELSALSALSWQDIDFADHRIRIPGTKNAARNRVVDLHPELAAALQRIPPGERQGLVLRPWANACTDLRAACKRAGIERVTPHSFRHSFGSWLVQAGVSTFVVGQLMGHKDSKMVERYYGHLAPKNRSEAMARLPGFPGVFTTDQGTAGAANPCVTGVPEPLAIHGSHGAHGAISAPVPETKKAAVSEEKRPLSTSQTGEGRRARTFNQRIKSPNRDGGEGGVRCRLPRVMPTTGATRTARVSQVCRSEPEEPSS